MQTIKFKVDELKDEYAEKIILEKLKGLDGIMDVAVDTKTQEVTLSTANPATCEGVYCAIENLGYKVHRP